MSLAAASWRRPSTTGYAATFGLPRGANCFRRPSRNE
ncbi:CRISPR-associated protein Cas5 [Polymorphobacter sp. PAMC 29334]|nr:CRISPR-associated protein Cas5 [Polymorphobacter sp. PAMC 29334]